MSKRNATSTGARDATDRGITPVERTERPDGTWEATQPGLDVVGTGPSAARATEDMAGQIAALQEADEP